MTDEPGESADRALAWAHAAVRGGATMVQLRSKLLSSGPLLSLARILVSELSVPLIVNDRVDVAILAGAAGVHVGADDLPVERVRALVPDGFIVGASVGSDDELAGARGADYVGVGPVFPTTSKPDAGSALGPAEAARLIKASGLPGAGIGGITPHNAREVIEAGADGIAVLSAVSADPETAARALRSAIGT
ncbi:MAG TPA: thiamine phosphate synthase [Gemmatimonadaceae bacterium]|nr:thiamine phosphate synthase [Gemmatimonadaceae bacterium]